MNHLNVQSEREAHLYVWKFMSHFNTLGMGYVQYQQFEKLYVYNPLHGIRNGVDDMQICR